jgi:hypothetical protein
MRGRQLLHGPKPSRVSKARLEEGQVMGISEQIRDSVIVIGASAFAAGAALSWGVAEKVGVAPKDDDTARLEQQIQDLKQDMSASGRETNSSGRSEAVKVKSVPGDIPKGDIAASAGDRDIRRVRS